MYLLTKCLHIVAVVLFLGNIITGLFWHAHAARRRSAALLAHTMDGIIRSDRLMTIPPVMVIVITGVALAIQGHYPLLTTPWIVWSLVLFSISGVIYSVWIAPVQRQLRDLAASTATPAEFNYERYHALAVRWEWWGGIALATPLAALVLMVLKPSW